MSAGAWCWHCTKRIQSPKADKALHPTAAELQHDDWIMTADDLHCASGEPGHPVFSPDKKRFSHKKK